MSVGKRIIPKIYVKPSVTQVDVNSGVHTEKSQGPIVIFHTGCTSTPAHKPGVLNNTF